MKLLLLCMMPLCETGYWMLWAFFPYYVDLLSMFNLHTILLKATYIFSVCNRVKSCFHIMDVCRCRSNLYDLSNRNKTSLMRPVASGSAANLTASFTKIGPLRSQVKTFLYSVLWLVFFFFHVVFVWETKQTWFRIPYVSKLQQAEIVVEHCCTAVPSRGKMEMLPVKWIWNFFIKRLQLFIILASGSSSWL